MKRGLMAYLIGLLALGASAAARADLSGHWEGVWSAQEGEFVVRLVREGERFNVFPVAPVGIPWTVQEGFISGQSATINAEFQGARGTILIQLTGPDSAIARPLSCQPDYHFICTLARNQQASFERAMDNSSLAD